MAVAWFVAAWIGLTTLVAVLAGETIPAAVALVVAEIIAYIVFYQRLIRGRWTTAVPIVLKDRSIVPHSDVTMRELP